ncbi:MAG: metal-binding protein [Thermoplasmata archaeon HGW-Thermoplasmata-1]|nr:MAG: metal-binding protein [Thermoplasmata archaeon HGW-Thermoplasmata-1]
MHKDELIQLHTLLVQLKGFLEQTGEADGHFSDYDDLSISPHHIHKSKKEHKQAVFVLCQSIADTMGEITGDGNRFEKISRRLKIMERRALESDKTGAA